MAIREQDIVILESAIMRDVPEGGGGPSGNVVVDGASNNVFQDISETDRALGNVSIRKLHVGVRTDDTETLMGLHLTSEKIQLIFTRIGTVTAMTHIQLPFTILPIYSVMRAIPATQRLSAAIPADPARAPPSSRWRLPWIGAGGNKPVQAGR